MLNFPPHFSFHAAGLVEPKRTDCPPLDLNEASRTVTAPEVSGPAAGILSVCPVCAYRPLNKLCRRCGFSFP